MPEVANSCDEGGKNQKGQREVLNGYGDAVAFHVIGLQGGDAARGLGVAVFNDGIGNIKAGPT
jgi:hypothetical protein